MGNINRSTIVRLSVGKKLTFGMIVTVGFFLVLELALAAVGVTTETATADPLVGFSKRVPLLQRVHDQHGQVQLRTATNKLIWFNDQQFPLKKPVDTRRVVCLGGSTTFGRPFADSTSFCGWLREFLPLADDTTHWEVINAGGVSYASYRVAAVMEELTQYQPDLFIVYTGQNEFLERLTYADMFEKTELNLAVTSTLSQTRIWAVLRSAIHRDPLTLPPSDTLPGEVDEMLNHTIGPSSYHRDDRWQQNVLRHYELNLRRMVVMARRANAEIVFVVPASNEKDCSPFKSELPLDVDQAAFNKPLQAAQTAAARGQWQAALAALAEAQQLDPRNAQVHYRRGQALYAIDAMDQARRAFQRAVAEDVCPLRAPEAFLAVIRTIAAEQDVTIVDFDKRLRELCQQEYGHSILGGEYFLDHVHPTIDAHRQLALWIIDALHADQIIQNNAMKDAQQQAVIRRVLGSLDLPQHGVALRNLAKVLHWAGKFEEAAPRARDALRCLPEDPESLLVLADCLAQTNRAEEASETYQQLIEVAPLYGRGHLAYGEWLLDQGEYKTAREHFSMAVACLPEENPRHARAVYWLGFMHVQLAEFREAVVLLQAAGEAMPNDTQILRLLAQAHAGSNDVDTAIKIYQRLLRLEADDVDALVHLGSLLLKTNQPEQALRHFEAALAIDSENRRARSGRDVVLQLASQDETRL